jgi:hypothetical protein
MIRAGWVEPFAKPITFDELQLMGFAIGAHSRDPAALPTKFYMLHEFAWAAMASAASELRDRQN